MNRNVIELLGIIAGIIVGASFTRNDEREIRIINSVGSVLFVIYGLLIHSWSVSILNTMCLIVNICKVHKIDHRE